ncbi:MAG: NAD(P)-dependent oxidoreductase [Gemmataceae bacterium]
MHPVGLIGVGLLGQALAERLLGGGFAVVGFDVDPTRRTALAQLGGQAVASAAEVTGQCRRVVLSLPDSDVVLQVMDGLTETLQPGTLLLDTTTGDPDTMAALAGRLATRGVSYLDTCVVGSSEQARRGEVLLLIGGAASVVAAQADLFDLLARQRFVVGGPGAGARAKLVVNLVLGLNRAVLAEGLALARACELDLAGMLKVLRSGAAYSRVMDIKGEKMLRRDFAPQARLRQHAKDVGLILEQAARTGQSLPLSEVHRALLQQAMEQGGSDEDNSAILRAYDPPMS